jgi:ornithine decarboxylase
MSAKIANFLAEKRHDTPFLVLDLDLVVDRYHRLKEILQKVDIYYAMKANPADEVVKALADEGSCFDIASLSEMDACLRLGVSASSLSFGHTIKKERDIARAHAAGIDLFAFDSAGELEKLARAAPESRVFCRLTTKGEGADWPLSKKFGCEVDIAKNLLKRAQKFGLKPHGISFHVGSQQTDPKQWDVAIAEAAELFRVLEKEGVKLELINLGGGLPAHYVSEVPTIARYGEEINAAMQKHFGNQMPTMIIEPGRGLVGDAGVIQAEVVLIADRHNGSASRWVYLDIGKFGGLPETIGEAIKYRIHTPRDGGETVPSILAGPTCEELDVLYERTPYPLPKNLQVGDQIEIRSAGAYTWSYSAVCFNGIPPLKQYVI